MYGDWEVLVVQSKELFLVIKDMLHTDLENLEKAVVLKKIECQGNQGNFFHFLTIS